MSTSFTRLVGCTLPIQLAPMAGPVGVELAAAVARAGGHALYPAVDVASSDLEAAIDRLRATTEAFGVNFIAPLMDPECLELAATRAPMVDLFYGDPDRRIVERIHAGGALASWQVGSPEEALRAVDAGCDVVVAQGTEAGGRIRGQLDRMTLLERVVASIDKPVLAAGGVATAEDVARAIDAGAAGVRAGTRFIAAAESNAHPAWQRALVDAGEGDTVITRAFARGVPDFPHRVLRRSLEAATARANPPFPPEAPTRGDDPDGMPFYAGVSAAAVQRIEPAAAIVVDLASRLAAIAA